ITGMVKHMWNLRRTAQQFAIEVLRPFTIVAQIRHWRGTGECRVLMKRYPFYLRAKPLRLISPNFTCGTLVKMFSSHILPLSANNSGNPLKPSINSGQTPGSHGSLSLAKPRTSQRICGLFPLLKEEVVSSSKRSLSSYVRPESDIRVSSERGVRQGCPLAPSLWTLVTVALLRAMAGTESLDWIQHDATMFADDLLLQWEYSSISELERMISAIQHCFRVLARLGLQVQRRKTQLLLAQKGRLAHKWWRAHTASTKEGRFLRIPQPGQKDLHLPIVPQLTYLGIVLSYKDATTATVEHRLHVAEEASQTLLIRLGVEDPLPFLLRAGQKLLTKTLQSQDPMVHQPRILQWLAHITEA
ncbi:unnamed protein product, partial [Symbiodinium microadriaticum]